MPTGDDGQGSALAGWQRDAPAPRAARPSLHELLGELAPSRERLRMAFRGALGGALALFAALFLGLEDVGVTVLFSVLMLGPTASPRVRDLPASLLIACAGTGLALVVSAPLVDLPWLLLPFGGIGVGICYVCMRALPRFGIPMVCTIIAIKTTLVMTVLVPSGVTQKSIDMAIAICVALSLATFLARVIEAREPTELLGRRLAAQLLDARQRLQSALETMAAGVQPRARPGLASPDAAAQNFVALRPGQEGTPRTLREHARRNALVMVTNRATALATRLVELSSSGAASAPAGALAEELHAASAVLADALGAYSDCVLASFSVERAQTPREPYGDPAGVVAALDGAWQRLRRAQADLDGAARFEAALATLHELAGELRHSPDEFLAQAEERTPPGAMDFREALRNRAWLPVAASMLALMAVYVAGAPEMTTAPWTAVTIQQGNYGAALRKTALRLAGATAGALATIFVLSAVIPWTESVASLVLVVALVALIATYGTAASAKYSYGFRQFGNTFFLCALGPNPALEPSVALWRLFGILVGVASVFFCFELFIRDTAGGQLVRGLERLLEPLVAFVRRPGTLSTAAIAELQATRVVEVQQLLTLFDDAVLEGAASGIDVTAATGALSLTRRVSLHAAALASLPAPLATPPGLARTRAELERCLGDALDITVATLRSAKAETLVEFGSTRRERRAAVRLAASPLPDLDAPLAEYRASVERELQASTLAAVARDGAARLAHFERLTVLVPALHGAVRTTCRAAVQAPLRPATARA